MGILRSAILLIKNIKTRFIRPPILKWNRGSNSNPTNNIAVGLDFVVEAKLPQPIFV